VCGRRSRTFLPVGSTGPAVEQTEHAKAVCRGCEVITQCLEWALTTGQDAASGAGRPKTSAACCVAPGGYDTHGAHQPAMHSNRAVLRREWRGGVAARFRFPGGAQHRPPDAGGPSLPASEGPLCVASLRPVTPG
jgi:hypothetical protein